jgi:hypothetical protein
MPFPNDDPVLTRRIRMMQIILSVLVGGCLIFMTVAVIVRQRGAMNAAWRDPIMTYIALAFALIVLVNSFILSNLMTSKGRLRIVEATKAIRVSGAMHDYTTDLYDLYQTRMIVTAAPREGGTFFLLIAYMLEGNSWSLVGAVVMVGVLAAMFPTFTRVERWVEEQREIVQQERMGL